MKRFLAIYTGSPTAMSRWELLSETEKKERQAAGSAAWMKWVEDNRGAILEMGGPLSRTISLQRPALRTFATAWAPSPSCRLSRRTLRRDCSSAIPTSRCFRVRVWR